LNWQKYPVPVRQVVDLTRSIAVALSGQALDAQEVGAVVDADVVGASVSPGLEDVEATLGGGGHEAEFDPLSALLEAFEILPLVFLRMIHGFVTSPKRKRRGLWAAPTFLKVLSYIFIISYCEGSK
jgi:hypothetical protein